MGRLINTGDLNNLLQSYNGFGDFRQKTLSIVESIIQTCPTAIYDYQVPKAGKWLDKKTTIKKAHGIAYGRWGCSVCKLKQPHKSNYCPNCGADMRELDATCYKEEEDE